MEIIYIDSLFLINLIVNYCLFLSSAKICSLPLRRIRFALAAVFGAVYAVCTVLPGMSFLLSGVMKIVSAIFMILIAFGGERNLLRVTIVFFAVSAAFGGAVYGASMLGGYPDPRRGGIYVPVSLRVLILSFAVCYVAISLVFRRIATRTERSIQKLCIELTGQSITLSALRDTGNHLYDPISGKPVVVMEAGCVSPLFPHEINHILQMHSTVPSKALELLLQTGYRSRFRLVPYTAIGVSAGLLLAFSPDSIEINGKKQRDILIALSPTRLCEDGEYCAVI